MGVGPTYAIRKVFENAGLSKDDISFYEINEAFGSQTIYSAEKIGIQFDKVNANGAL
ncbi:thiolase [Pisolithus marmoratus]|nr:thiolase [Pisolithus marmoratus]